MFVFFLPLCEGLNSDWEFGGLSLFTSRAFNFSAFAIWRIPFEGRILSALINNGNYLCLFFEMRNCHIYSTL